MMEYIEKNYAGKSAAQTAGHLPGVDSDNYEPGLAGYLI